MTSTGSARRLTGETPRPPARRASWPARRRVPSWRSWRLESKEGQPAGHPSPSQNIRLCVTLLPAAGGDGLRDPLPLVQMLLLVCEVSLGDEGVGVVVVALGVPGA